jgi:two-component system response regulator CiaR
MKKKILIVDDTIPYLESLTRVLSDEYFVETAINFNEALSKAKGDVDLFLIDICLDPEKPGIDKTGIEILRWVKTNQPNKPVIMMSAFRDFDAAVEAVNLGAEKFLKKPININELREIIRGLI